MGRDPAVPLPPALLYHLPGHQAPRQVSNQQELLQHQPDLFWQSPGDADGLPEVLPEHLPLGPGGLDGPVAGTGHGAGSGAPGHLCPAQTGQWGLAVSGSAVARKFNLLRHLQPGIKTRRSCLLSLPDHGKTRRGNIA